jgi:uncharacterized protein YggT (Ycf19 family)
MNSLVLALFLVANTFFWLLVLRVIVTLMGVDPYRPNVQFLLRITKPLVDPFRIGPLRRPSPVDPAVAPPLLILLIIVVVTWNYLQ